MARVTEQMGEMPFVSPVSAPTLSQIENGVTMPSLETLQSLGALYGLTANHFVDLVQQDQMTDAIPEPADADEAKQLFLEHLTAGRVVDALGVAIHSELGATTEFDRLCWRTNRASALQSTGQIKHAAWTLLEITESPGDDPRLLWQAFRALADAATTAGMHKLAAHACESAVEYAPDDAPPEALRMLHVTRARTWNDACDQDPERAADLAQKALSGIQDAQALGSAEFEHVRLRLATEEARASQHLGDLTRAEELLRQTAAEARKPEQQSEWLASTLQLGLVLAELEQVDEARQLLDDVWRTAAYQDNHVAAFEAAFALYRLATGRGARELLERCRKHYAHIQAATPSVRAFEKAVEALR